LSRLALAAALLTLACFGGSAPRFFTLSAPQTNAPLGAHPELGLAVGPVDVPTYLDRPEIVSRDGANRLTVADDHRWAGSLRNDIMRVVADELGRLLGTPRVAVYPDQPRFPASYRVLLDVREFEPVDASNVRLRVRWTIAAVPEGRALAVEESVIDRPIASTSYADIVAAESSALEEVTQKIAARVADLSAGGTPLASEKPK
jgi:uncharacterized lipoprotein YmbA